MSIFRSLLMAQQQEEGNHLTICTYSNGSVQELDLEGEITYGDIPLDGLVECVLGTKVTSLVYDEYEKCNVFTSCTTIKNITIPNSVISIDDYAFSGCSSLTSITIPNSVTSIGSSAFKGCTLITSITIPSSVTSIGNSVFYGCSRLSTIIVDNGNSYYDSRNDCNAIIKTITNTLVVGCKNTTIPNSVISIDDYAFSGCSLTSIYIPSSVTSIGNYVFYGCSRLSTIIVDNGNSYYDSRNDCNAIIKTITNTLVVGCKNSTIPNSVISIDDYAFSGCSLTSIYIPSSVTSIGNYAFGYCGSLTSIDIPNSVTSIGRYAFRNCTKLSTIYYNGSATGAPWGATNATVITE